jgi:hypothetical protein
MRHYGRHGKRSRPAFRPRVVGGRDAPVNDELDDALDAAFHASEMSNKDLDAKAREIDDTKMVAKLAKLKELDYQRERAKTAKELGVGVGVLDKLVRQHRAQAEEDAAVLPHWVMEPWGKPVDGAKLLDDIEQVLKRYIVLPKGAAEAIALWNLHAWTIDAGDISPFLVLVSPTKRCGKTSVLIVLLYLTPRSELASNISSSALFRYVEEVRPTLLIDEADSFLKDNEELRGILNSGHTKPAAYVIRNVEVNGEHKPRRFSTWAPKAIATIRSLADTLEDRAIVVQLQRKPSTAKVARLRRRDNEEFATLRRQAFRWAKDNFAKLDDPDPSIPDVLNDRAADNWRPLLAIADLVGGHWPAKAREAACLLSGEAHDTAINVDLLADIWAAFYDLDVIRSDELVNNLVADPERPWAEWNRGKPLSQKQLAGLLKPFGIASETVHPVDRPHGKGYKRARFLDVWEAYLPGQNASAGSFESSEACKRANAGKMGISCDFRSVQEDSAHGSKNANLSYSHAGLHACADRKAGNGAEGEIDHGSGFDGNVPQLGAIKAPIGSDDASEAGDDLEIPDFLRQEQTATHRCDHCGGLGATGHWDWSGRPDGIWLHPRCEGAWTDSDGARASARADISERNGDPQLD